MATRFFGVKGKRYKPWWCGNDDKIGGVDILVKEELCEKVVEVRRCDRIMAIGFVYEEEVVRVICAYEHGCKVTKYFYLRTFFR